MLICKSVSVRIFDWPWAVTLLSVLPRLPRMCKAGISDTSGTSSLFRNNANGQNSSIFGSCRTHSKVSSFKILYEKHHAFLLKISWQRWEHHTHTVQHRVSKAMEHASEVLLPYLRAVNMTPFFFQGKKKIIKCKFKSNRINILQGRNLSGWSLTSDPLIHSNRTPSHLK